MSLRFTNNPTIRDGEAFLGAILIKVKNVRQQLILSYDDGMGCLHAYSDSASLIAIVRAESCTQALHCIRNFLLCPISKRDVIYAWNEKEELREGFYIRPNGDIVVTDEDESLEVLTDKEVSFPSLYFLIRG